MRKFEALAGEKCADTPDNGKIRAKTVNNWSICTISGRTTTQNEQKPDLCAILRLKQAKNAETLQIMVKLARIL